MATPAPAPSPLPQYLYKILPSAPPSPLPADYPLSDLDRNDGFIHFSTAAQVPITAGLFFTTASNLWLLKLPYAPLAEDDMRWEAASPGTSYPHLYGRNFGAKDVVEARGFERAEGQTWGDVFTSEAWLEV
ncbi:hypothetical protein F5X68DRAFT_1509 [Plectosphaerella plurivora]|uniref:DUF952 domain-containing protein n=1 Tax=Plectosphaerella plurivora TaxID=936078 RepID=A0A9P9AFF3_9PEZI|nr:hypothetical protein F5X68DRAFT_1509 [Plectosphaerella plurivora]